MATSVTCDRCGTDLTDGGGYPSYRLHLAVERCPNKGGVEYAVHVPVPIRPNDTHFCGVRCLSEYVADLANLPKGFG